MTTWNTDIDVNVFGETQAVDVQGFGRIVHATEEVEATFTDLYRVYESNNDASADVDLSAGAKAAAAAFFSQENRPPDLAIAAVTYTTIAADLATLLASYTDFYGVACASRAATEQEAIAVWAEANDRLASGQSSDPDILPGTALNLFETLNSAAYTRSFGSWHDDDTEYLDLTYLARILSADPDEQSSVAHDKTLTRITAVPDVSMTAAQRATLVGYNGNAYLPLKGADVMRPGTCWSGKTIEDRILEDWFQARLEEAIAALLVRKSNANDKVSFDDFGIGEAEGEIRGVYDLGVGVGHFIPGSLTIAAPKYATLTTAQIASKAVVIPLTCRKRVGLKDFTLNVGVTF